MGDEKKEIVWSHSRVNTFHTCPRQYYFNYILKDGHEEKENCFAQYGTFMHELIEEQLNGVLTNEEVIKKYKDEFEDRVTERFPFNKYKKLKDSYYMSGLQYLKNMKYFKHFEVESTELDIRFEIAPNVKFRGFIDAILKKEDEIYILDHKSKGNMTKSEQDEYFRQQYLYSFEVENIYGRKPDKLAFNLFRPNKWIVRDFDGKEQADALQWLLNTIDEIKNEKEFPKSVNDFFCKNICSHREICEEVGDEI